ncbi:MAG: OmpA family protein [Myxococcaceae bacterium]|nr:OmpA family protein [Myxococcaceae bacterium]
MTGRLVAAVVCLISGAAVAQTTIPGFELERLELNPGAQSSLVNDGGRILRDGGYRLSLAGHYERDPLLVYRGKVRLGSVVSDRVMAHLLGAYGIGDRFEVGAQIPVVAFQQGDDLSGASLTPPASAGLGTIQAYARVALLDELKDDPLSLAVGVGVGLPFGSAEALAQESGFAISPRVGLSHNFGPVIASADGAFVFRTVPTQLGDTEIGDALAAGLSVASTGRGFRAELDGRATIPFDGTSPDLELLAGVRYPVLKTVELYALGGPGFGSMPGSPVFRFVVGAALGNANHLARKAPPPSPPVDVCAPGQAQPIAECPALDKDGDGVKNVADACPEKAEDADGFEDADGCPDPDNDADGVLDAQDKCPIEAGQAQFDGCPPPDQDKDGILDADDQCPGVPGTPEKKGCPFLDEDKDGIEDAVDVCPKEAGPVENRGCPIKDTDEDTVPDHLDNCPNEKGDPKNQGCPKKVKQLVVITREKIVIKEKVYFATGKARVLPRSYKLLNQVAKVINEHPQIPHVLIEGHTDNRGSAELNRRLSQARADAVRDYLVHKGKVDPTRLSAIGYGPDRPAADNSTAKGREANRRVEFTVQEPAAPAQETFEVVPLVPTETPAPSPQQDGAPTK